MQAHNYMFNYHPDKQQTFIAYILHSHYLAETHKNSQHWNKIEHYHYMMQSICKVGVVTIAVNAISQTHTTLA